MRCQDVPGAFPLAESFPRAAPAPSPSGLSADFNRRRSKWNHMGGTRYQRGETLTSAVRGESDGRHRRGAVVPTATAGRDPAACRALPCNLHGGKRRGLTVFLTGPLKRTPHPSCILPEVSCGGGGGGLESGRPSGAFTAGPGGNASNSKHANGRETKPQATDIQ